MGLLDALFTLSVACFFRNQPVGSNLPMTEEPVEERVLCYRPNDSVDPKRTQKLGQEVRLVLWVTRLGASLDDPRQSGA